MQHKNVLELIRGNLADIEEFGGVAFETHPFETDGGTQNRELAMLNEQQATLLITYMRNSDVVRRFKKALVKAFYELREKTLSPAMSTMDILKLAMATEEARQVAVKQRDEAIETKSLIGAKREATAMNTASQAVKHANNLQIELDRHKEYATIKRMEMLYHGQCFKWRLLKDASIEIGIPPVDIFDANYGTVKAYHADAWQSAYALEIEPIGLAA